MNWPICNRDSKRRKRHDWSVSERYDRMDWWTTIQLSLVVNALQQEKQRVNDLEGDLEALQKQLRHAQTRLIEQVRDIMFFSISFPTPVPSVGIGDALEVEWNWWRTCSAKDEKTCWSARSAPVNSDRKVREGGWKTFTDPFIFSQMNMDRFAQVSWLLRHVSHGPFLNRWFLEIFLIRKWFNAEESNDWAWFEFDHRIDSIDSRTEDNFEKFSHTSSSWLFDRHSFIESLHLEPSFDHRIERKERTASHFQRKIDAWSSIRTETESITSRPDRSIQQWDSTIRSDDSYLQTRNTPIDGNENQ